MKELIGTGVALVTPFKNDLSVDYDALKNIVNLNIENGTNYLVIMGTTGESVTINKTEKKEIIKVISDANKGRLPLVLGIGGNNTAEVIDEIKNTDLSNISALLFFQIPALQTKLSTKKHHLHFLFVLMLRQDHLLMLSLCKD